MTEAASSDPGVPASPAVSHGGPDPTLVGGRYRLVRQIASGGMATVWSANDLVLSRDVAVKLLHPHLADDPGFLTRFRREAVAAARLRHPNIVGIYDTVSDDDHEAIVMELVDGPTLRDVLDERGRLAPSDVVDLGIQVSDALACAHAAGIVHRDIKPSNILICRDRRVLVTDFGIAKAGEDTDLTVTGTLLGTAKYLAPEQVEGRDLDPRADLYALGVVLFEAVTGHPPFRADTDAATALARLHQTAPRSREYRPDVPRRLDDLIGRLLERHADDRPDRAADVRASLSGIDTAPAADETLIVAPEVPVAAHEPEPDDDVGFLESERSWLLPAVLVLVIGAALVVTGFLVSRSGVGRTVIEALDADPVTSEETVPLTPVSSQTEVAITVGAWDPLGDGAENDDTVSLAADGDLATEWRTESYRDPIGLVKGGVGLRLELAERVEVTRIELDADSVGWTAEVYVLDGSDPDPAALGDPLTQLGGGQGPLEVDVPPTAGTTVILWITETGTAEDGSDSDSDPDLRFELSEIRVLGRSVS